MGARRRRDQPAARVGGVARCARCLAWIARLFGSLGGGRRRRGHHGGTGVPPRDAANASKQAAACHPKRRIAGARTRLGGVDQTAEHLRDQRGLPWLDLLRQDMRYAARMFRKRRGLQRGGADDAGHRHRGDDSTIFSLLNGVVLAPLPYPAADAAGAGVRVASRSCRRFRSRRRACSLYRHERELLEGIAGFTREDLQLSARRSSGALRGVQVSSNYFTVLGAIPALGRAFTWTEERRDADVVVISDAVWRRRLTRSRDCRPAAAPERTPFTVVGVMPAGFEHVGGTLPQLPAGRDGGRVVAAAASKTPAEERGLALHQRGARD